MHKSSRNKSRLLPPRIPFKCCFCAMAEHKKKWKIPPRTKTINEAEKNSTLSHFVKHHTESGLKFFYRTDAHSLTFVKWVLAQPSKLLWWASATFCHGVWSYCWLACFQGCLHPPSRLKAWCTLWSQVTCSVCSLLKENIHPKLRQMKVILERIVRWVHSYNSTIIKTSDISTAIVEGFALLTHPFLDSKSIPGLDQQ